jgi:hypothetical protein
MTPDSILVVGAGLRSRALPAQKKPICEHWRQWVVAQKAPAKTPLSGLLCDV